MERRYLNSKIHKATVTDSNINYEGSCEIDVALLKAANIRPYEQIDIYDISNGERLSTYAIPGKPDTGIIAVNGAACHKININDQIIIELKTIPKITNHEIGQMMNYLRVTNLAIGLLLNFKYSKLEWKRVIVSGLA